MAGTCRQLLVRVRNSTCQFSPFITWIFIGIFCFYGLWANDRPHTHLVLFEASTIEANDLDDQYYRLAVLPGSADGKETKYHAHMKAVLNGCKYICRVDIAGTPSLYFDHIDKEIDCHALMTNAAIDAPMVEAEPPRELPAEMVDAFTYGGRVRVVPFYNGVLNQRYMGSKVRQSVSSHM